MPSARIYQLQKWGSTWWRSSAYLSFSSKQPSGNLAPCKICLELSNSPMITLHSLKNSKNWPKWRLESEWLQVFDLGGEAPDAVLRRLYLHLETLKLNGDEFAPKIEERLKIIVSWVKRECMKFIFIPCLITAESSLSFIFSLIWLISQIGVAILGGRWWWHCWLASWSCFWP